MPIDHTCAPACAFSRDRRPGRLETNAAAAARYVEYQQDTEPYAVSDLEIVDTTIDGPHGPIPVRIWSSASADELGVDSTKITIGGASAGGNRALAAILRVASPQAPC